jgi:hypothetical protein
MECGENKDSRSEDDKGEDDRGAYKEIGGGFEILLTRKAEGRG